MTKDHGVGPIYPDDVEMGLIRIESHTKVNTVDSLYLEVQGLSEIL